MWSVFLVFIGVVIVSCTGFKWYLRRKTERRRKILEERELEGWRDLTQKAELMRDKALADRKLYMEMYESYVERYEDGY